MHTAMHIDPVVGCCGVPSFRIHNWSDARSALFKRHTSDDKCSDSATHEKATDVHRNGRGAASFMLPEAGKIHSGRAKIRIGVSPYIFLL